MERIKVIEMRKWCLLRLKCKTIYDYPTWNLYQCDAYNKKLIFYKFSRFWNFVNCQIWILYVWQPKRKFQNYIYFSSSQKYISMCTCKLLIFIKKSLFEHIHKQLKYLFWQKIETREKILINHTYCCTIKISNIFIFIV